MIELRGVFLIEESEFGQRLFKLASGLNSKLYRVATVRELKELIQKRTFDSFVWVATHAEQNLPEVEMLLKGTPYLFACLFSDKPVARSNFDFTFTFDDFEKQEKLKTFVTNLHRLGRRLKTRKELSSLILHDLRTPLQNLSSYVDMLTTGTFGELNEGQLKILQTINAQADLADELVQELTLILRMRKMEFFIEKQKTDLSLLIHETLRALWIWADRKNIKLQTYIEHDLPDLFVDPLAIRRVLSNLLLNALKFSPNNGTVRLMVTLESAAGRCQKVHFRITDSGPGIPPEHLDTIFDPYFRLKNPKAFIKGQGLGLYIAKLFVEAHGGTIGAYNNREGGATFYFTLPVA